MSLFTLSKDQRIKQKKIIDALFVNGHSFCEGSVRVVFLIDNTSKQNQVAFSVSKKRFKLAVDRNRVKRLMRESYRLHQSLLPPNRYRLMLIYTRAKKPSYLTINKDIILILQKLSTY